jgi:hypothetical protein
MLYCKALPRKDHSMVEMIHGQGYACVCDVKGCHCDKDEATVRVKNGKTLCACCYADCPHAHDESYLKDLVAVE